jgi:hypothetical protein
VPRRCWPSLFLLVSWCGTSLLPPRGTGGSGLRLCGCCSRRGAPRAKTRVTQARLPTSSVGSRRVTQGLEPRGGPTCDRVAVESGSERRRREGARRERRQRAAARRGVPPAGMRVGGGAPPRQPAAKALQRLQPPVQRPTITALLLRSASAVSTPTVGPCKVRSTHGTQQKTRSIGGSQGRLLHTTPVVACVVVQHGDGSEAARSRVPRRRDGGAGRMCTRVGPRKRTNPRHPAARPPVPEPRRTAHGCRKRERGTGPRTTADETHGATGPPRPPRKGTRAAAERKNPRRSDSTPSVQM